MQKQIKKESLKKAMDKSDRDEISRNLKTIRGGHGLSNICKDYLDQIVDCSTKRPVGAPTLIGGVPGRTSVYRLKEEVRVVIGTLGYGFLSLNYSNTQSGSVPSGPFRDAPVFTYSTSVFAGNVINQENNVPTTGIVSKGWNLSKRKLADFTGSDIENQFQWRCVSAIAECTNTTAVLDQAGTIVMWEPPNHGTANANSPYPLSQCESERTSRVIRAQNGAEASDRAALNWHPKAMALAASAEFNDFFFNTFTSPPGVNTNTPGVNHGLFVLQGDPGDSFHFSISAIYEVKGRTATGVKPRLTDGHGMNIVFNTLAAKALDGYVGNPRRVADGYLAKAWEVAKKLGGWVKEHESTIMKGTGTLLKGMAGLE